MPQDFDSKHGNLGLVGRERQTAYTQWVDPANPTRLRQAMLLGVDHEREPAVQSELLVDVVQMDFYCALGDSEFLGDHFVAKTPLCQYG